MASLYRDLHRSLWPRTRHVRKQFSAGQGPVQLSGDLQRVQTPQCAIQRAGEDRVVLEDGGGFLQAEAWLSVAPTRATDVSYAEATRLPPRNRAGSGRQSS